MDHVARFPALLAAALLALPCAAGAQGFNYAEAMQKALFFYDVQRSGRIPASDPVTWRADSGLRDGADVGLDLTGGWYDAGDHVKFGLPMASSAMTLSWAVHEYGDAIQRAGLHPKTLQTIRWATDYFIKAHPAPDVFYYQVGNGNVDHGWWGPAEVMEEVMARPAYKVTTASPGSTVAGATAAALAAASIVFQQNDPAHAELCLRHARELYEFADATRSDAGYRAATGFYDSFNGYWDELSAAATWLYLKTGDPAYLARAEAAALNWQKEGRTTTWAYRWTHSWDDMHYMTAILLARITGKQVYVDAVERNLAFWLPGGGVTYTPGGLAWLDRWGSLRYAANASFLAFVWSDAPLGDPTRKPAYRAFAERQIDYILGRNPRSSSYVVGFGQNPPRNPHHRTAHGAWYNDIDDPPNNRHVLFGALVGGPGSNDAYADLRTDYQKNEVATDYNAGFFGALAKMYALHGGAVLANFPAAHIEPAGQPMPEYFVRAKLAAESATSTSIVTQTSNRSAWPATVRANLSYRYFFDVSELVAAGGSIADVRVTQGSGEAGVVRGPFAWGGTVYYVEMDLTGTRIFPGGRAESERESSFTLSAPVWNPANDWSRQGIAASPFTYEPVDLTGYTPYVPVYAGGVLLAGREAPKDGQPPPASTPMSVASITLAPGVQNGANVATAQVRIVDAAGAPVSGAQVTATWSGLVSGTAAASTDGAGVARFTSPRTRKSGTITLAITGVSRTGYVYAPGSNVETTDSVAVP